MVILLVSCEVFIEKDVVILGLFEVLILELILMVDNLNWIIVKDLL